MAELGDLKMKVKLRIKSCICNLVLDEVRRKEEDLKLMKEKRKAAYEAWIDSIPLRYEYEKTCREVELPKKNVSSAETAEDRENFFDILEKENREKQFGDIEDIIEFSTDGEVLYEDGFFSVIYDESVLLDTDCKTIIKFNVETPKRMSLYRTGNSYASLVFDVNMKRITCMYETFAGQISMCVITHNIINTISDLKENGKAELVMDYTLEMGGMKTEYTHYEMLISAVDDQDTTNSDTSVLTVIKF